jgi:hypothetical protein
MFIKKFKGKGSLLEIKEKIRLATIGKKKTKRLVMPEQ